MKDSVETSNGRGFWSFAERCQCHSSAGDALGLCWHCIGDPCLIKYRRFNLILESNFFFPYILKEKQVWLAHFNTVLGKDCFLTGRYSRLHYASPLWLLKIFVPLELKPYLWEVASPAIGKTRLVTAWNLLQFPRASTHILNADANPKNAYSMTSVAALTSK